MRPNLRPTRRPYFSRSKIALPAINAYLNKQLDDWTWLKHHDLSIVRQMLQQQGVQFHTDPYSYQAVGTLIGIELDEFMYILDVGMGKTKLILDILNHHKRTGRLTRPILALSPTHSSSQTWIEQAQEHTPNLVCRSLVVDGETHKPLSREERFAVLEQPADLYTLNYPGLQVFMTQHNKERRCRVPDKVMIREFVSRFGAVVYDEMHHLGNHESLVYSLCNTISRSVSFRYGAGATPFGRDPHAMWPQMKLIDRGKTFGETLGLFRAAFFTEKTNYWSGGSEWKFQKRMKPQFARFLRHRSISYAADECMDLPEVVPIVRKVDFSTDAAEYYQMVVKQLRQSLGHFKEVENAFLRMRQLASGFISIKDDLERAEHTFDENPKLEALASLIEEIPDTEKFIIFYEFNHTGHMIHQMLLDELKVEHARLYGGAKDGQAELARFKQKSSCRGLLANWKSGGESLNLQHARYAIFFESPVSPRMRIQCEGRMSGARQKHKSFIYDLVVRGSIEERILEYLKEGKDLFESIRNHGGSLI